MENSVTKGENVILLIVLLVLVALVSWVGRRSWRRRRAIYLIEELALSHIMGDVSREDQVREELKRFGILVEEVERYDL